MLVRLSKLLMSMLRKRQASNDCREVRDTYGGDEQTKPHISGQRPDTIAEVQLDGERNDCTHDGYVYGSVMRTVECLDIAESTDKPIVDVGPS